jgi:hypothetical protein
LRGAAEGFDGVFCGLVGGVALGKVRGEGEGRGKGKVLG